MSDAVSCIGPDCSRPIYAGSVCQSHYLQQRRGKELRHIRVYAGSAERAQAFADNRNRLHKELAEMSKRGMSVLEQCKALNLSRDTVFRQRVEARRAGFNIPRVFSRGESAKWKALDAVMRFSCGRCSLRGPTPGFKHECLGRAENYMRTGLTTGGE